MARERSRTRGGAVALSAIDHGVSSEPGCICIQPLLVGLRIICKWVVRLAPVEQAAASLGQYEITRTAEPQVLITRAMINAAAEAADFHIDFIRTYGMPEEALADIIRAALEAAPRCLDEGLEQPRKQLR